VISFLTCFNLLFDRWLTHRFSFPTQQSALLRKIVDRIRHSLELKVVLQTAVDEVTALLKLDRCIFFWYFKDTNQVQIVCERLKPKAASLLGNYRLDQFGSAAAVIDRGEMLVATGNPPRTFGLSWLQRHLLNQVESCLPELGILNAQAILIVPVRGRKHSIGFIACLVDQPRWWLRAEVEFMQAIAQQLEIAVRQAQFYDKMQKQVQREKLVNQITTQTRQSLDLPTILTKAIAHLSSALDVDRCLVHLVEDLADDSDSASGLYQPGTNQTVFRRKHLFEVCRPPFYSSIDHFDTNGPIARWIIRHRQPVVIPDITQDFRIGADNEEYQQAQIKSSLVVPVKAGDTLYAILYLNQCSHLRYWSWDDQKLAQAVADQLAISIQQATLYAQSKQQAAESAAQARELADALHHLQQIQVQLIQSEKMSSLGQMVAGVAHEMNNPVSFIYGNIPYVEKYMQDLLCLLNAYQQRSPEATEALQGLIDEIELDFLLQDFPRILQSMQAGASRIREIVLSLRSFSRLDEAYCKLADVNEGLNSTLTILQSHLKSDVQVIKQYSNVPRVECYPRQLNQVFLNLLMNAIESLYQPQPEPKTIEITTERFLDDVSGEAWVRITIKDNGCGIPYEIQSKIFDPFFTTKKTGQGAGLGLAVCYQTIVNHHQGTLKFHSEAGLGSQFVVEIPIKHSDLRIRNRNLYLFSKVNMPSYSSSNENGNGCMTYKSHGNSNENSRLEQFL